MSDCEQTCLFATASFHSTTVTNRKTVTPCAESLTLRRLDIGFKNVIQILSSINHVCTVHLSRQLVVLNTLVVRSYKHYDCLQLCFHSCNYLLVQFFRKANTQLCWLSSNYIIVFCLTSRYVLRFNCISLINS